jgi:hypothetical protein
MLSDCCCAKIAGEIEGEGEDACGRCSKCGEMSGVFDEDDREYDEDDDDE